MAGRLSFRACFEDDLSDGSDLTGACPAARPRLDRLCSALTAGARYPVVARPYRAAGPAPPPRCRLPPRTASPAPPPRDWARARSVTSVSLTTTFCPDPEAARRSEPADEGPCCLPPGFSKGIMAEQRSWLAQLHQFYDQVNDDLSQLEEMECAQLRSKIRKSIEVLRKMQDCRRRKVNKVIDCPEMTLRSVGLVQAQADSNGNSWEYRGGYRCDAAAADGDLLEDLCRKQPDKPAVPPARKDTTADLVALLTAASDRRDKRPRQRPQRDPCATSDTNRPATTVTVGVTRVPSSPADKKGKRPSRKTSRD